jgi:hypothetical protein
MTRTVDVEISEFAVRALEGEDGRGFEHVPGRLARGIRYYLKERDSGRVEWRYPEFRRRREPGKLIELPLRIDEGTWSSLEEEAARQGVTTQQLLEHAGLFFAADVNAGRVTRQILDDIAREGEEGR